MSGNAPPGAASGWTLRTQLLVGYLAFVAALAALGAWSSWQLLRLSHVPRLIIAENYDSVVAAKDMKESLERMDSAALFLLLGRADRAAPQLAAHRPRFDGGVRAGRPQHHGAGRGRADRTHPRRARRLPPPLRPLRRLPAERREPAYFPTLQPRFDALRDRL